MQFHDGLCVLRGEGAPGREAPELQRFLGPCHPLVPQCPHLQDGVYDIPAVHPHWLLGCEAHPLAGHPQCSVCPSLSGQSGG